MKKIYKAIAGLAIAGTLCAGAATFAACKKDVKSYNGEYHYANAWGGADYGIKVRVSVQSDKKGDRIKNVEIMSSAYTEASNSNPAYGWDNSVWYDNVDDLLLSYRGRYIADVLVQSVGINTSNVPGQPESVTDDSLNITGATQGSGRLLLAVQHALADAAADLGYTLCEGEYHYPNAWSPTAPHYGIKVKVVVKDNKICKVAEVPAEYVSVTSSWGDKQTWFDGYEELFAKYEGRNVDDVCAIPVSVSATGQPNDGQKYDGLVITGATQGSGRLLLAVQNALTNAGYGYQKLEGEYHYANPWGGADYGIKVNVLVSGDTVKSVSVASSDYVSVTDRWQDKEIWNNGLDGLLAKYVGKNVVELLAIDVSCNPATVGSADTYFSAVEGQPDNGQELGGLVIAGATQGSGRLLLAVQDALLKLDTYKVVVGEYSYDNPYSAQAPKYGIKVKVVLKGDEVVCVKEANHAYTAVSDGWNDKQIWIDGLDKLLAKYEGKSVAELLALDVACNANGQPESVSDDDLFITGATQGSGRLLLAVQNALSQLDGYEVLEGEYSYDNPYSAQAPKYGIKVKVVVKDGKVLCVREANHGYTAVTDSWTDKQTWFDGYDELFAKYEGKTVAELLAIDVATNPETVKVDNYFSAVEGQPNNGQELGGLLITGATQGSGRLLLAVQDALSKLEGYEVLEGEYSYDNPYSAQAPKYGIKVKVVVKDGEVLCVKEANHGYTSVTSSWTDKQTWFDGYDGLFAKYEGKSVAELLALDVATNPATVGSIDTYFSAVEGQPNNGQELGGLVITGATQGSGRLLLAVQDALSKLDGYQVVEGEYHYANPWGGADYGIKVKVVVKDNTVLSVREANHAYTSVTSSWTDKQTWFDGIDELIAKYEGKTVTEITAIAVTCNPTTVGSADTYFSAVQGQPDNGQELGGLVITGATQGSGRLLLAVKDALFKLN